MKQISKVKIITIFFTIMIFFTVFENISFSKNYFFKHYTIENGLSDNAVYAILQDNKGYMWFGTSLGLSRFNGVTFDVFKNSPKDSLSLGNNQINDIYQDSNNSIWLATGNGLFKFDSENESFTKLKLDNILKDNNECVIYSVKEDSKKNIWFTVLNYGVIKYSLITNECVGYNIVEDYEYPTKLCIDWDNDIWVCTLNGNILKLDYTSNTFIPIELDSRIIDKPFYAIYADNYGNIWFGNNNIYKYNKKSNITKLIISEKQNNVNNLHYISEMEPGILSFCSDKGILNYSYNTDETEHIQSEDNKFGLNDNSIYSCLIDKEGGRWYGSLSNGINYLPANSDFIETFTYGIGESNSPTPYVNAFCEDNDNNIWIGSNKGLWKYIQKNKKFISIKLNTKIQPKNIQALHYNKDEIWICTYSYGIYKFNLNTLSTKHYDGNSHGLNTSSAYSIFQDSKGTIWIGSHTDLYKYNKNTDSFTQLTKLGLNIGISSIIEDDNKNIWFTSDSKGLFCYNTKTDSLYSYNEMHKELPSSLITLSIRDNILYIGSRGYGLYTFDIDKNNVEKIDNHIIDNRTINTIIQSKEYDWIETQLGMICYSKQDSLYHNVNPYLNIFQHSPNTSFLTSTGEIYVGNQLGFSVYNIEQYKLPQNNIPSIIFKSIKITSKEEDHITKNINNNRSIKLRYDENSFSIQFLTTNYSFPKETQYIHKLEGQDDHWIETNYSNSSATYTNLKPGTYHFLLKVTNNGFSNQDTASFRIHITNPWWKTDVAFFIYFIIIITLLTITTLIVAKRISTKSINRINEAKKENERKLYNSKINFFTNIAHEIRTPVSLIIAPIDQIMKQTNIPPNISEDLEIINKNSNRLLSLVNQILDFTKIENKSFISIDSKVCINELIYNIVQRFTPAATNKGIKIYTDFPKENIITNTDNEAVIKIISNLLNNALKFTKSIIKIVLFQNEDNIEISIEDDGIGMNKDEIKNIFKIFYQNSDANISQTLKGFGIGLSIVNLLIKRLSGEIRVESEKGVFSKFTVSIPIKIDKNISEKESSSNIDTVASNSNIIDGIDENKERNTQLSLSSRILIIEDNEEFLDYLDKALSKTYTILTANNGVQGIEILHDEIVDIIITDLMMPEMDGLEFCKKIKKDISLSHIPIILLTAKTDIHSKISGLESGADVYVEKPVTIDFLIAQISSLLNNRYKLRELFSMKPFTPINSISGTKSDEDWLIRLNDIINKNISNTEFSVDEMASLINMSRSLLYNKLKTISGLTPNDFIKLIRLKKAAEMIASNQYRINEVCYSVGFNSPSYFAKCFQKQFGVLPKDFIEDNNQY